VARKLALAWLQNRNAVDATVVPAVLRIAAQHGDAALLDALVAAVSKEKDRGDRAMMLAALGSFGDPALTARALDLILTDTVPTRESIRILLGSLRTAANRPVADAFVRAHFDEISERLPDDWRATQVFVGASLCDDAQLASFESFYRARIEKLPGGPRDFLLARESLRTCAATRTAQAPTVARFFAAKSASR
jgi:hypothetical protein